MNRHATFLLGLASLLLVSAAQQPVSPPTDRIQIRGAIERPLEWTPAFLRETFAQDLKEVTYKVKDQSHEARGIPLVKLVQKANLQLDEKRKNHQVAFVIVVRGRDGYTVTFSMGELLPEIGNREVFVIFDRDGEPLPEGERPARLVVMGDAKPTRCVYGIESITIADATKLSQ